MLLLNLVTNTVQPKVHRKCLLLQQWRNIHLYPFRFSLLYQKGALSWALEDPVHKKGDKTVKPVSDSSSCSRRDVVSNLLEYVCRKWFESSQEADSAVLCCGTTALQSLPKKQGELILCRAPYCLNLVKYVHITVQDCQLLCLMRKPAVTPCSATALTWQLISDHQNRQATATKTPMILLFEQDNTLWIMTFSFLGTFSNYVCGWEEGQYREQLQPLQCRLSLILRL